jgi:membrane associated rhomboid family serine protease
MIPLRDEVRCRRIPWVCWAIIALNALLFLYELGLGADVQRLFLLWGIVPVRYFDTGIAGHFTLFEQLLPFVSYQFLHGGWLHFLGNMWFLKIFGDNVEDAFGHFTFLGFYLGCGLAAGLFHLLTNPLSTVPTIGASGAIAGVMGAYLVLYPRARVVTLVPIFIFFHLMRIPAVLFLGVWFFLQFYNGALSLAAGSTGFGGVAWWAHVGGFLCGLGLAAVWRKRYRKRFAPVYRYLR